MSKQTNKPRPGEGGGEGRNRGSKRVQWVKVLVHKTDNQGSDMGTYIVEREN